MWTDHLEFAYHFGIPAIMFCGLIAILLTKSRSTRLVLFGTYVFWVSYFWYWLNLLTVMRIEQTCQNEQPWYNPFTCKRPMTGNWRYTPLEVFVKMCSDLCSILTREFAVSVQYYFDQQSWFSVLPASMVLILVIVVLLRYRCEPCDRPPTTERRDLLVECRPTL